MAKVLSRLKQTGAVPTKFPFSSNKLTFHFRIFPKKPWVWEACREARWQICRKPPYDKHYPSILMTVFWGGGGGMTEHFSGKNEEFWWEFKSIMYKSFPNQNLTLVAEIDIVDLSIFLSTWCVFSKVTVTGKWQTDYVNKVIRGLQRWEVL